MFILLLSHNFIPLFQKNIRKNLTQKFVINFPNKLNFNKLHLIIHQVLTFKTLWIFIKSILQNHALFCLLILLLHQISPHVSENFFQKEQQNWSWQLMIKLKIKTQYDINRGASNISALSSSIYEYLTGE